MLRPSTGAFGYAAEGQNAVGGLPALLAAARKAHLDAGNLQRLMRDAEALVHGQAQFLQDCAPFKHVFTFSEDGLSYLRRNRKRACAFFMIADIMGAMAATQEGTQVIRQAGIFSARYRDADDVPAHSIYAIARFVHQDFADCNSRDWADNWLAAWIDAAVAAHPHGRALLKEEKVLFGPKATAILAATSGGTELLSDPAMFSMAPIDLYTTPEGQTGVIANLGATHGGVKLLDRYAIPARIRNWLENPPPQEETAYLEGGMHAASQLCKSSYGRALVDSSMVEALERACCAELSRNAGAMSVLAEMLCTTRDMAAMACNSPFRVRTRPCGPRQ